MNMPTHRISKWKTATVLAAVLFSFVLFFASAHFEIQTFNLLAYAAGSEGGGCTSCGDGGGSQGGGNHEPVTTTYTTDKCPNIAGVQSTIPSGYVKDSAGNCVIDQCPNITGVQTSVPSGYMKDSAGNCVIDQCPNIADIQTSIPSGYVKDSSGNCVIDQCPNIDGVQTAVPSGYVKNSAGNCVIDQCPNIADIQESVPAGYVKNTAGNCVVDQCPNIADIQESIPNGYVKNDAGNCVIDQCPNISGIQETVPDGKVKDSSGNCVVDQCPNISGIQTAVPDGYTKDSSGQCVQIPQCIAPKLTSTTPPDGVVGTPYTFTLAITGTAPVTIKLDNLPPGLSASGGVISGTPTKAGTYKVGVTLDNKCGGICSDITIKIITDMCPNIDGIQTTIPSGKVKDADGNCVVDQCPNITGVQTAIPDGYTKDTSGNCVIDQCPNISGIQTEVPAGKTKDSAGNCVDIPQCVPPKLTSPATASGKVGEPFTYTLTMDGTAPVTIKWDNLPPGLTASGNTISGTPTAAGTFSVSVMLDNKCGGVCTYIKITITKDVCPNISGDQASIPNGYVKDSNGNCVIDQCPNISGIQNEVPNGYVKNSSGNCVIDQCPNIDGIQETVPSGKVKDSHGNCVVDQCPNIADIQETVPAGYTKNSAGNCVVDQCPNIDGLQESIPAGYVKNTAGNCVVDQCPNLDGLQESVPAGYVKDTYGKCVIDQCPNISGIQLTIPEGYTKDSNGQCVQIPQCIPPKLTSPATASGKVGEPFTYTVTVSGTGPITISADNLPPGLTINGNTISGTPTKEGTYKVGITLDNKCGGICTYITITITKDVCPNIPGDQATIPAGKFKDEAGNCVDIPQCIPIVFNAIEPVSADLGDPINIVVTIATGTNPTLTASSLPAGLSFDGHAITGTPTQEGTYEITITGKNTCCEVPLKIKIVVKTKQCVPGIPAVTSAESASGTVGTPFSYTITSDKTGAEFEALNLPAGLTYSTSTGVISGTPTATGTFTTTVKAKNNCGVGEKTLTITIVAVQCTLPPPSITSSGNASGTVGTPFSYHIDTTGTVDTVTVTSNLPAGLTFDAQTRTISGTPTEPGSVTVSLGASNSCGSDTKQLVIVITTGGGQCTVPPPTISSGNSSSVTAGQQFSYTITTTGTVNSIVVENLPSWLNYASSTGVIFGTAPSAGNYSVTIRAANQCGSAATELAITVVGVPGCTVNCGGGGFFSPTVTLQKVSTSTPLAAFASVYLSQVPYTGLNDVAASLSFLALLFAISATLAYVYVYRPRFRFARATVNTTDIMDYPPVSAMNPVMHLEHKETGRVFEAPKKPAVLEMEVKTFGSMNLGASAVAGLGSVKEDLESVGKPASASVAKYSHRALAERLEKAAKQNDVLLGADAADLIVLASDEKEENAAKILTQIVTVAREWYPAHEGSYLLLDAAKVRTILFSTYVSMVPLFIKWIAENKEEKALSFVRMLNAQGHAVSDFFKAVAFELDKVYRFRTERESGADHFSIEATHAWKKETLEKVVTAFVGAFDGAYTSSYQSAKLALSKVMSYVKQSDIPLADAPRLPELI